MSERLSALFDAHADRLYRLARRLVPSADDALDLVQETFLRVTRSAGSIPDGASREEAWLVRVLVNVRRDQWRRDAVRKRYAPQLSPETTTERNPEKALLARTAIWSALDLLPPRRRAVVVMHELEGLPVAAVASVLGISVITVRWHLSRGRRELALTLKVKGGENDEQPQSALAGRRSAASRGSTR